MAKLHIILEDTADDQVRLDVNLDSTKDLEPEAPLTASMVMVMGIRMLFDSGDIWEAGLTAARATAEGIDPLELAKAAAAMRDAGLSLDKYAEQIAENMKDPE